MRILTVGGTGYIGSRLYEHLKTAHHDVKSIDLQWFGNPGSVPNVRQDYQMLNWVVLQEFDAVVLLAGHASVPMCRDSGIAVHHNNVLKFVGLLNKLKDMGAKAPKLVYASTASIYGGLGRSCEETEDMVRPQNYYDLSMWERDQYARMSGVDCYGLRFGTVNGWSPNFRVDIMLNKMYHDALTSSSIEVQNPGTWRPILAIQDLCSAVQTILESSVKAPGVYNLCSFNATVAELARITEDVTGTNIRWGNPSHTYDMKISIDKIRSIFGWGPGFQDGYDILKELAYEYRPGEHQHRSYPEWGFGPVTGAERLYEVPFL